MLRRSWDQLYSSGQSARRRPACRSTSPSSRRLRHRVAEPRYAERSDTAALLSFVRNRSPHCNTGVHGAPDDRRRAARELAKIAGPMQQVDEVATEAGRSADGCHAAIVATTILGWHALILSASLRSRMHDQGD